MSLPELCPLDGKSGCKTRECHLYHVDWRSGEENCSIGYHVNQKPSLKTDQLQDTYAQNTSKRLGREIPATMQIRTPVENVVETTTEDAVSPDPDNPETTVERVVTSDRNTTVIESNHASGGAAVKPADVSDNDKTENKTEKKKGKSIDDAMKLDLPDNYEEEFWS